MHAPPGERTELLNLVDIFRGRVVDVAASSVIIEVTGSAEKIDNFIELMRPYGIKELARSGVVALVRGDQARIRLMDFAHRRRRATDRAVAPAGRGRRHHRHRVSKRRGGSDHDRSDVLRRRRRSGGAVRARPSPCSATARRATPTRSTCATSGHDVRVGLPETSSSRAAAEAEGLRVLTPDEACAEADVIMVLTPDTGQRALYDEAIAPHLRRRTRC